MNPDWKKEKENTSDLTQELETKGEIIKLILEYYRHYKLNILHYFFLLDRFLLQQLQPMFWWLVGR